MGSIILLQETEASLTWPVTGTYMPHVCDLGDMILWKYATVYVWIAYHTHLVSVPMRKGTANWCLTASVKSVKSAMCFLLRNSSEYRAVSVFYLLIVQDSKRDVCSRCLLFPVGKWISQTFFFFFMVCRILLYGDLNVMNAFLTFAIEETISKP